MCRLPDTPTTNKRVGGLAWSSDGNVIVFSRYGTGIYEVPARGGEPRRLADEEHADDLLLIDTPHGRAILFAVLSAGGHDLIVRTPDGERRKVAALNTSWPELVYSPSGHVLFRRNPARESLAMGAAVFCEHPERDRRTVHAGAFRSRSEPRAGRDPGVSRRGWKPGAGRSHGAIGPENFSARPTSDTSGLDVCETVAGRRVAPSSWRMIPAARGLWIYDTRRFSRTRFALGSEAEGKPILFAFWTEAGKSDFLLGRQRDAVGHCFVHKSCRQLERTGEGALPKRIYSGRRTRRPTAATSWRSHSKQVVAGSYGQQIWYWRSDGAGTTGTLIDFSNSNEIERATTLSPNGRYLAYTSTASGREEVHVRPFPDGAGRWQISSNGGTAPRWSPDGTELFFVEGNRPHESRSVDREHIFDGLGSGRALRTSSPSGPSRAVRAL